MNGTPGDHPLNDILDHGITVFSEETDALVREIAALVPCYRLDEIGIDWLAPPPLEQLTERLRALRDEFKKDAEERGWDT